MGQKVTLGGDRLGSGKKQKIELHNYERSTHNLSEVFTSSMSAGILYPCYTNIGLRGDTFDIDINTLVRTAPTIGPLFGSFKMQIDVFTAPIRLYQGLLHNNALKLGLNMKDVKLPMANITSGVKRTTDNSVDMQKVLQCAKMSNSCLLKYLGLSGLQMPADINSINAGEYINSIHSINAVPILAYYDIFKNYYANKQEEKAYVIMPKKETDKIIRIYQIVSRTPGNVETILIDDEQGLNYDYKLTFEENTPLALAINKKYGLSAETIEIYNESAGEWQLLKDFFDVNSISYTIHENVKVDNTEDTYSVIRFTMPALAEDCQIRTTSINLMSKLNLEPFNLSNIDDMRLAILSENSLGTEFYINDLNKMPYNAVVAEDETSKFSYNVFPLNGLCVKTYQSDIFNTWVNTDWIDGDNGVNAITAIDTSEGSFDINTMLLHKKIYDMLNRIAISGGTYEDWQDAVYTDMAAKTAESPIYWGGMSAEIAFDEVVSTAVTEVNGEKSPLGVMGGRGKQFNKKAGHVVIKLDEASVIMAIASITPRLNYSQGNAWYLTELKSVDDLHKPALDQIGFEDLMAEQMAWWAQNVDTDGEKLERYAVGKIPAWTNYRTAFDKVYGEFCEDGGNAHMVLQRNYEMETHNEDGMAPTIKDVTTYIDPSKYNYAFAYTDLEAQNFYVQISFDIKARRLMSAAVIPNL